MEKIVAAVNALLAGGQLQKTWADNGGRLCLKLRLPGRTALLLLSSSPGCSGVGLAAERPATPQNPPALAAYLRAHAVGGRLEGAASFGPRGLALYLATPTGRTILALDGGQPPRLLIADSKGAAKVAERWDAAGGLLRPGGKVEGLPETPDLTEAMGAAEAEVLLMGEGERLLAGAERAGRSEEKKYVGRWRKKLQRRIDNIRRDLENAPDPAELRNRADALAASLHLAGRGAEYAEIEDPAEPGRKVRVELDSRLSPGKNLTEFYRAARKAARTREIAGERLAKTLAELEGPEPSAGKTLPARQGAVGHSEPFRRYKSSDGWLILVGKNRVENDQLLKEAKPWDLWLHALGGAGTHVVVKKPGKESTPPERTLIEAAGLAALHSSLAENKYVEVTLLEAGRVRKPKGAGPGKVLVSGGETVRVRPGEGRAKPVS